MNINLIDLYIFILKRRVKYPPVIVPIIADGIIIKPINILDNDDDILNTDSIYLTINVVNDTIKIYLFYFLVFSFYFSFFKLTFSIEFIKTIKIYVKFFNKSYIE